MAILNSTIITGDLKVLNDINISGTVKNKLIISGDHGVPENPGLLVTGGSQNYAIRVQTNQITKGTAPSTILYNGIEFYGNNMPNYAYRLGMIENVITAENVNSMYMRAYSLASATSTTTCDISCNVDASGNVYTSAPTPATSDNSTKIATTAFVKNVLTSLNPQIEQFGFGQNTSEYSTKPWLYLGQCNMPTQTNMMIFEIYGGNGQNGNSSQNLYIKIMLKRGYSTSGVGVTAWVFSGDVANQYSYSSGINVKGIKDSTGNILDLYVKMPFSYPSGTCILTNLSSNNSSFTSNFTFVAEPSGTNANCNVLFFNPSTYI